MINKKTILAICLFTLFTATPLLAVDNPNGPSACRDKQDWAGSYYRKAIYGGIPFAEQFQFFEDGSVILYGTAYLEQPVTGTSSPGYGRWKCRQDGKIVATVLFGNYGPDPNGGGIGPFLHYHARVTALFSIVDDETLMRSAVAWRVYPRGVDPTDPNGGDLYPVVSDPISYTRLTVSTNDLDQ